jgi:hypothetical protein
MAKSGYFTAGIFVLLLLPLGAFAAGFAKESLFLSKSPVTQGDTVLIHAVVDNAAATKFAGSLQFADAGASIGSVPVALSAGESSVVSLSWKPLAGSHTVTATLKDSSGTTVEQTTGTFDVAAPPQPAAATSSTQGAAAVESSAAIQQNIGNISPPVEAAVKPAFTLIDGARTAAAGALDSQLAATKQNLGPNAGSPGQVLGAEATKNATQNPLGAVWYILQTLYFYLLTVLRFVVGSAGLFYPIVAIAFLYLLWRMFRRFRRPAY